jgi:multicomponent Na+:H+ antiporter subunit G
MGRSILVDVLLGAGVVVQLISVVGVLAMPHVFDRLHYLTPASSLGVPLVAAAVVAREALSHQGISALLVAGFLFLTGPVLTHATARAARMHGGREWQPRPGETVRWP